MRKRRLKHQFQDVLKGDVTDQLNWLLVELFGPTLALEYVPGRIPLSDLESDRVLSSADVERIRFSDRRVEFSAADPRVLETHWPLALRAAEFEPLRDEFHAARDQVLSDIESEGQAGFDSAERLIKSVDDLLVALDEAYPPEKRRQQAMSMRYHPAKRYLKSLAGQAHRATREGDRSLFDETLRFEGGSVVELIQHMHRKGLVFAPPPPGGDRVYRSLLCEMRSLYLTWGEGSGASDSDALTIASSID